MPISGRLVPELSMISNQVTDWICNTNRRKVSPWNHGILNPPLIATYEDADNSKGAALDNCFCFIDETVWPISWPMSNQRVVYNGHKRMHAFKFQAVTLPNRLIANMKEHSCVISSVNIETCSSNYLQDYLFHNLSSYQKDLYQGPFGSMLKVPDLFHPNHTCHKINKWKKFSVRYAFLHEKMSC